MEKKIEKHNRKITKVERRPDETKQECVDRAVPKLIDEGMTSDQAVAAANEMCDLREKTKADWKGVL